jgi:hypothetical protein
MRLLHYQLAFALIPLFMISGCSPSPTPSEGRRVIEDRIANESQGRIALFDFQKDNGMQGEINGFKIYKLEFTANIEFVQDCKWLSGTLGVPMSFRTVQRPAQNQNNWGSFLNNATEPGQLENKGDRVQLSGVLTFVKKEKGWAVESMEVEKISELTIATHDPIPQQQIITNSSSEGIVPNSPTPPKVSSHSISDDLAALQNSTQIKKENSLPPDVVCVNNLKRIGLSFRIWAGSHDQIYPFNVSTNGSKGAFGVISPGTMEFCSRNSEGLDSSAFRIFGVMSNELGNTGVLVCPSDNDKRSAVDFAHLRPENVSYQVFSGPNLGETTPDKILVRCPIHGTELLCDGSVRQKRQ